MKKNRSSLGILAAFSVPILIAIIKLSFSFYDYFYREYHVKADQSELVTYGMMAKYNKPGKVKEDKSFTFSKNKVWCYNKSSPSWTFIIGSGQTTQRNDSTITYLTGRLTDISHKEWDDEVIKISTLRDRSSEVCVCNFDSICVKHRVTLNSENPLVAYQSLFPDSINHRYVDSIFDMNQLVHSKEDIKKKYHKSYQP